MAVGQDGMRGCLWVRAGEVALMLVSMFDHWYGGHCVEGWSDSFCFDQMTAGRNSRWGCLF